MTYKLAETPRKTGFPWFYKEDVKEERCGRAKEELADADRILAVVEGLKDVTRNMSFVDVRWVIALKKVAKRMKERAKLDKGERE